MFLRVGGLILMSRRRIVCVLGIGVAFLVISFRLLTQPSISQADIEALIRQTVRADCPPTTCSQPVIDWAVVDYAGHHYYLVRIPLPFEALGNVISYRLVACDQVYSTCTVVDKYQGRLGVVRIDTRTGPPRLHWEPFIP